MEWNEIEMADWTGGSNSSGDSGNHFILISRTHGSYRIYLYHSERKHAHTRILFILAIYIHVRRW